jgi:hypothetical protein
MNSKKIHELTEKISNNRPGSTRYLAFYKRARRQVEEELTEGTRQKYKAMAKDWSEKQPPQWMQQRYVLGNDYKGLELTDFSPLA